MPTIDLLVLGLMVVLFLLTLPTLRELLAALDRKEEPVRELAPSS